MNMIRIEKLTGHQRNNELPQLSQEEKTGLKRLIELHGFNEAIEITENNTILDGHNRVEIAKELNIEQVPFRIVKIEKNVDKEFEYILEKNSSRRQMTQKKVAYLRGKIYLTQKGEGEGKKSEQLAKEDGVSEKTIRRDAKFVEDLESVVEGNNELKDKILNNEIKATKEDIKKISEMNEEDKKQVLKKAEECGNVGTAYKEIHGDEGLTTENAPNLKLETLRMNVDSTLTKLENNIVKLKEDEGEKKKIISSFKAFKKKINALI